MSSSIAYTPVKHQHHPHSDSISQEEEFDNEDYSDEDKDINSIQDDQDTERSTQGWSWVLLISGVTSAMFFYCLDKSVVTILIPVIVGELGEATKLPWVFVGFGLGSFSLALPIGKIYTLFDFKILYLGFLSIFLLGSALCGAAWNMNALIFGRVLAGIGGIGVYTGIMTILTTMTTQNERPIYLGVVGLFWSIGRVVGPLFGGILGKKFWRWGFYLNFLVFGLFIPVYLRLLPHSPSKRLPLSRRFLQFDPLGVFLNSLSVILLFTGINFGGTRFSWDSPQTISIFTAAAISIISFGIQQATCFATTAESRIFPLKMLFNQKACLVFAISATSSIAGFLPANFISLYFQFTQGDDSLYAAFRLLPMIVAMSLVMPVSGYLIPRIGNLEWWPIIGSIVGLPGSIIMVQLDANTYSDIIYVAEILIGAGMGCYMQLPYTMIRSYIHKSEEKDGMSFIIISQIGGIALSMSISSAIFTTLVMKWLKELLPEIPIFEIESFISGTSSKLLTDLPTEEIPKVLNILIQAMIPAWIIVLLSIFVGLGASTALLMWKLCSQETPPDFNTKNKGMTCS
ncbi:major facilitator superfamily domain-containing protein [Tricladium varicosporioides]|nr:major facilitator superfamily domain-containing protein [Hymenoscyphus varicosporioides]